MGTGILKKKKNYKMERPPLWWLFGDISQLTQLSLLCADFFQKWERASLSKVELQRKSSPREWKGKTMGEISPNLVRHPLWGLWWDAPWGHGMLNVKALEISRLFGTSLVTKKGKGGPYQADPPENNLTSLSGWTEGRRGHDTLEISPKP